METQSIPWIQVTCPICKKVWHTTDLKPEVRKNLRPTKLGRCTCMQCCIQGMREQVHEKHRNKEDRTVTHMKVKVMEMLRDDSNR